MDGLHVCREWEWIRHVAFLVGKDVVDWGGDESQETPSQLRSASKGKENTDTHPTSRCKLSRLRALQVP